MEIKLWVDLSTGQVDKIFSISFLNCEQYVFMILHSFYNFEVIKLFQLLIAIFYLWILLYEVNQLIFALKTDILSSFDSVIKFILKLVFTN